MSTQDTQARVLSMTPLTDTILQVILQPDEYIEYQAGQYLQILFEDTAFSYSIANAPLRSRQYELHIRHTQDNPYDQPLFAHMKREGVVTIRLPLGTCHVGRLHLDKPIVFIAGGTGFAPIKAMIEDLLAHADPRSMVLYWGARSQTDLYFDDKALYWHTQVPHFTYVSHPSDDVGQTTLIDKILSRESDMILECQMVLSGPFDRVYDLRDALVARGVSKDNLFSDAF